MCEQGRSDGGLYRYIYTPQNQSTQNNLRGCSSPVSDPGQIQYRATVRI